MSRLLQRVKAILLTPQTEWVAIAREPGEAAVLFPRYVAILALIPAIAGFVGSALIGGYVSLLSALLAAIAGYVLTVAVVFVVALGIDALAPRFEARADFPSALKLAVYSYTPVWLAGVFLLVPGLSFLAILGLYGGYLLWLGLPVLMRVPAGKALPFAVAIMAGAVVLAVALGLVHHALSAAIR